MINLLHGIIQPYNGNPLTCRPSTLVSTHTQMILHTPDIADGLFYSFMCSSVLFEQSTSRIRLMCTITASYYCRHTVYTVCIFPSRARERDFISLALHTCSVSACHPHTVHFNFSSARLCSLLMPMHIQFSNHCVCVSKYRSVCVLCIRFLSC